LASFGKVTGQVIHGVPFVKIRARGRRPVLGTSTRLRSEGNEGALMPACQSLIRRRPAPLPTFAVLAFLFLSACLPIAAGAASIRGVVTDTSGARVKGATVGLLTRGQVVASAVSGADGSYEILTGESGRFFIVVSAKTAPETYIVIDGFQRIAALQRLGKDTVDAGVWTMSESEALLLERSLRASRQETSLEQGWLLAELEQRFGYSLDQLARRFDRSVSWVSRRLALVELLPESIQRQVRDGHIGAQAAMRFLVPAARVNVADCERLAAAFVECRCDHRQAAQLYAAWRTGTRATRDRIRVPCGQASFPDAGRNTR